ncbi:MAG TPA: phenylacetate--CoA ligase, partial [Thermodesulfobacteriaceae bacterium]|nr:phenylacetate--CoA ligase [Thermodesulfobacteriaceae bacterium]
LDKKGVLDKLEVWIEVDEHVLVGGTEAMQNLKHTLQAEMLNDLYINVNIKLVEPKTLERSMGKATRILDRRDAERQL